MNWDVAKRITVFACYLIGWFAPIIAGFYLLYKRFSNPVETVIIVDHTGNVVVMFAVVAVVLAFFLAMYIFGEAMDRRRLYTH